MSRHTKEKKNRNKAKHIKCESLMKECQLQFDIMFLLRTSALNLKPNLAKFIQRYVKSIRGFNANNIQFYPEFKYTVEKVFVRFLDGHELLYLKNSANNTVSYYFCYGVDELEIKENELLLIKQFFDSLFEFKFVY